MEKIHAELQHQKDEKDTDKVSERRRNKGIYERLYGDVRIQRQMFQCRHPCKRNGRIPVLHHILHISRQ